MHGKRKLRYLRTILIAPISVTTHLKRWSVMNVLTGAIAQSINPAHHAPQTDKEV